MAKLPSAEETHGVLHKREETENQARLIHRLPGWKNNRSSFGMPPASTTSSMVISTSAVIKCPSSRYLDVLALLLNYKYTADHVRKDKEDN